MSETKFCDNPKCFFHDDRYKVEAKQMIIRCSYKPDGGIKRGMEDLYKPPKRVEHQRFIFKALNNDVVYLCDVCYGALELLRDYGITYD